ncbi:MAG: hypothetical protein RRY22_04050 [Bacilli bacterium]
MIEITKRIPFENKECYGGLIYHDGSYYGTVPKHSRIDKYDSNFCKKETYNVCNPYFSITHFCEQDNFCLSIYNEKKKLFLTDCNFNLKDTISLKTPTNITGNILSIFANNKEKTILIATPKNVYSVTMDGYFIKQEVNLSEFGISKECCPSSCSPCQKGPVFTCAGYFCGKKIVAFTKNNSSYIAFVSENGNIMEKHFVGDDIKVKNIIDKKGKLKLLVSTKTNYDMIICTDFKCECQKPCTDCPKDVYFEYCKKLDCGSKKKECDCEENFCFIIESIARIEVGLSHILNAEGEKIQKILEISNCEKDILEVNESVNRTVSNITILEQVLLGKLEIAQKCLFKCKDDKSCCK